MITKTEFWKKIQKELKEVERSKRFTVEIMAFGERGDATTSVIWYAKSATIPSYTVTSVTHKFLDNQSVLPLHFSSVAHDWFVHGFVFVNYTTFIHNINTLQ